MDKRPGFIVVIIVFIVGMVGFYLFLKKQQNPDLKPMGAIPINAAAIIEIKKPIQLFEQIGEKNGFFRKLKQFSNIASFNSKLESIDSAIRENDKIYEFLSQNTLLVSFHEVGNRQFHPLYVLQASGRYEVNQLFKQFEVILGKTFTITQERYNQARIFKIDNNKFSFFYCFHNGLLLGSTSDILLEDAIRQTESTTSLLNSEELHRLIETSGDHSEANIFIQFNTFQKYFENVLSESYLKEHSINQFGSWMELDLNVKNETFLLNGFANTNPTENQFMSIFKGQEPQSTKFLKFVPKSAEGFLGMGISDYKLYKENLRKYMEDIGELERYNTNHSKVRELFGNSIEDDFNAIFKGELAQVNLAGGANLFYIKTKGYRDASELLNKWLTIYCKKNNQDIINLKTNYSIDAESVFPIYKMPVDYLPTRLLGPWFKSCRANYVSVFDDYIILGDTYKAISKAIYNNVLQKTLYYDGAYTQFSNYLSSKVNFFGFISLSGTGTNLENLVNNRTFSYYKKHEEIVSDFYAVAWQFTAENNMYYNNFLFRHQPSNTLKAATQWETRLDTVIASKPMLVVNHYTRDKEIFVQDAKNNIYLINNAGRILWKVKIAEPIMGSVMQVDYFKNGKLQILFNTKSKIYLLDRNGNFVERYPIKLPELAAAPLAVFDYENRKNYRLFIPLENKKVQVYNIEGKIVTGFKFAGTDHKIISPVQYFRNDNKDYIVVTDESRIYILNRKGTERLKPQIQFQASPNNLFEYQPGNSNRPDRLVRTDKNGVIYYIYFNGEVEKREFIDCSINHYFSVQDLTGDKINDFIFIDNNELSAYNLTGKKIFSHKFSTTINLSPAFYRFSSTKTYLGVTESESRKIYLFNGRGEILDGFPLPGKTNFSIGFLEKESTRFNLVVGGDEYYLYNFKLN